MLSDFQYGFNSSRSTADLLIEFLGLLTSLGLLELWHLIYPNLLKGFFMLVFFTNLSSQIFDLVLSFLRNRRLHLILNWKSSHEYPVNAGVAQGSILDPTLFLLCINDLLILLSILTILLSILSVIRHLRQQLELVSELESDVWNETLTLPLLLKLPLNHWSFDMFYEISFSWGYAVSL